MLRTPIPKAKSEATPPLFASEEGVLEQMFFTGLMDLIKILHDVWPDCTKTAAFLETLGKIEKMNSRDGKTLKRTFAEKLVKQIPSTLKTAIRDRRKAGGLLKLETIVMDPKTNISILQGVDFRVKYGELTESCSESGDDGPLVNMWDHVGKVLQNATTLASFSPELSEAMTKVTMGMYKDYMEGKPLKLNLKQLANMVLSETNDPNGELMKVMDHAEALVGSNADLASMIEGMGTGDVEIDSADDEISVGSVESVD